MLQDKIHEQAIIQLKILADRRYNESPKTVLIEIGRFIGGYYPEDASYTRRQNCTELITELLKFGLSPNNLKDCYKLQEVLKALESQIEDSLLKHE